jgi:putative toxin-antitoxin system antitoxin component (TIGR02293 family)
MARRGGVTARAIARTLGGPRALKAAVGTWDDLRRRVEEGLRYESVDALSSNLEIGPGTIRAILRLPERTFARRKKERRLRPDESDRLMRIGRIATLAEVTLGTREKAASWLKKNNRALGDRAPLDRLDTDLGAREVEDLLLRIAHGVYS